jgi:DNA-directed RNA polymerase subunit H (RpoH/RPB5)
MDPQTADILLRSRNTVLDILDERGYDTTVYRNIAPDQILTLAEGDQKALDMTVPKKEGSAAPCPRATVIYQHQEAIRLRMGTWVSRVPKDDDVIVLLNEPYHEIFDKTALQMWQTHKTRISFFHIKQMVVHPGRHVLVPPHRKLSTEEAKAEMERLHVVQKSQLPLIKHHDIQARVLGLVPGDVVEILRPSPTSGVARVLRICAA